MEQKRQSPPVSLGHQSISLAIISKLHSAISSEQRLEVTRSLREKLDAKEYASSSLLYDQLLQAGITNALCLHLGLIFRRYNSSDLARSAEIDSICQILNLIYTRCTAAARDNSLSNSGLELFQFLIVSLRRRAGLPVTSILHVCSGSLRGSALLFQCRLVRSIAAFCAGRHLDDPTITRALLGLLKNVSNFGEEHCMEIVENSTLMLFLASIPFTTCLETDKKSLERLSAIIRNLVVSPSTRTLLANHGNILGSVARMGATSNRHVQRNILSFLLSLCQDMDMCVTVSLYGDGAVLDLLRQLMGIQNNTATRRRAVRVVRLLAREASGSQVARDTALIATLSQRALHDASNEVRAEATDAISRISSFINVQVSKHHVLPLMQLASSPLSLPEVFSLALIKHSAKLIYKLPMEERGLLFESLAQIALSTSSTTPCKQSACSAILDLSREESIRARIASTSVLEALTRNVAIRTAGNQAQNPFVGIQALTLLATVHQHRLRMATHPCLLRALIHYVTSVPTPPQSNGTKRDVKKAIVALVSAL
ncbi:expressed unknown protein [Seminavis robusta]|uniref:Uncharacterized protein n=1 Tax=Seminavis robusta TaxID=568900 RepID=A0A9N8DZ17_9STRA|nr:expressed unknown protein [Seminavis robusta]|eukprot:Sro381_g130800.1 n/a (542) ;mRNA; f:22918-24543